MVEFADEQLLMPLEPLALADVAADDVQAYRVADVIERQAGVDLPVEPSAPGLRTRTSYLVVPPSASFVCSIALLRA